MNNIRIRFPTYENECYAKRTRILRTLLCYSSVPPSSNHGCQIRRYGPLSYHHRAILIFCIKPIEITKFFLVSWNEGLKFEPTVIKAHGFLVSTLN